MMMHSKCSEQTNCLDSKGRCKSGFPKPVAEETHFMGNGNVIHKRKSGSDQYVVGYNPYCIKKFRCHINLVLCSGIHHIKYIYAYMAKGQDHITAGLKNTHNQMANKLNYTFKAATQAMWEILSYKMHFESHCVFNLKIHLPGQDCVYVSSG